MADSLKTTSGIVALISLVMFGAFFVVLDFVGPRRNFCGNSNPNKKYKAKIVKPIYKGKWGTKFEKRFSCYLKKYKFLLETCFKIIIMNKNKNKMKREIFVW